MHDHDPGDCDHVSLYDARQRQIAEATPRVTTEQSKFNPDNLVCTEEQTQVDGALCTECDKPWRIVPWGATRDSATECIRTHPFCMNHEHHVDWRMIGKQASAAAAGLIATNVELRRQLDLIRNCDDPVGVGGICDRECCRTPDDADLQAGSRGLSDVEVEAAYPEAVEGARERVNAIARAAVDLCRSGYDGPFMGDAVAPLFAAVGAAESTDAKQLHEIYERIMYDGDDGRYECDCGEVGARHLDDDGHLPYCHVKWNRMEDRVEASAIAAKRARERESNLRTALAAVIDAFGLRKSYCSGVAADVLREALALLEGGR